MLREKHFVKKTRKAAVISVSREHYLRDDIWCGYEGCNTCNQETAPLLKGNCILPDTNVVLHQLDLLEHPSIKNAIITTTVLEEVKHRSLAAYNRLRVLIADPKKRFFVFVNEHCRGTFIEQRDGESINDRNDRAIRGSAQWYGSHLATTTCADDAALSLHVLLLTNDAASLIIARSDNIPAMRVVDYVRLHGADPALVLFTNSECLNPS